MENHLRCSLNKYKKRNKYFLEIFPEFSEKSFFKLPANDCLYIRNYNHEICLELSFDKDINLQKKKETTHLLYVI